MARLAALIPYLPLITLWVAVLCVASLVARELGFARLKKYPLTVLLLVVSLGSFPAGGVYKASRPYQRRIVAMLRREKSPDIAEAGCSVLPPNNIWNRRVSGLPMDPQSAHYIQAVGASLPLHPDFGAASGIPYVVADGGTPEALMTFGPGGPESERGPYRIPEDAPIETSNDAHVIVLNRQDCALYELFAAVHQGPHRWAASSAAIFDLRSNLLRPDGWTSADAAGLPIFPGLARYEEVAAGRIGHALRFTVQQTRRAYVWPARHYASRSTDPYLPPMGQRFRLRSTFDIGGFSPQARVILTALKEYGLILADNGGNWFFSGSPDSRWATGLGREFQKVLGSDLEAVDTAPLMIDARSGEARQ